jgi:hypothetical protein
MFQNAGACSSTILHNAQLLQAQTVCELAVVFFAGLLGLDATSCACVCRCAFHALEAENLNIGMPTR